MAVLTAFSILVVQKEDQKAARMVACSVGQMGARMEAHLADRRGDHLADQKVARTVACSVGQMGVHLADLLADLREGQLEERWADRLEVNWEDLLVDSRAAQLVEI